MDFDRYLADRAALVERFLDEVLPPEDAYPSSIHRAVRYSLFAGGKRLRPILALAAGEAVGGRVEDVLPAAAALEMIHSYSLIHDDLPAMDDDTLRRGKPTAHVVFGEAIAILAGDALHTHAFRLLATRPTSVAPERRLEAIALVATAAGVEGMIGGQVVDLESEGRPPDAATLEYIHRHKTGALLEAAARVGGLLGGGEGEALERLGAYGAAVGLAFQIVDDILDVEGEAATLGKSAGKDARQGKLTYPAVHGIERARDEARRQAEAACRLVEPFGSRAEPLVLLARRIVERRS